MTTKLQKFVETAEDFSWVLKKPRLTEKAVQIGSQNVYTFDVDQRANKIQIKKAIALYYKVTPLRVNVIATRPRAKTFRGRVGQARGAKKAMVFLKKGDTINFV